MYIYTILEFKKTDASAKVVLDEVSRYLNVFH